MFSKNQNILIGYAHMMASSIRELIDQHFNHCELLGPKAANIEKKANHYTWCLIIKSNNVNELHNLISTLNNNLPKKSSIKFKIDVDAQYLL